MTTLFLQSAQIQRKYITNFSLPLSERDELKGCFQGKPSVYIRKLELEKQNLQYDARLNTILSKAQNLWEQTYNENIACAQLTAGSMGFMTFGGLIALPTLLLLNPPVWVGVLTWVLTGGAAVATGHFVGAAEAAYNADQAIQPQLKEFLETEFKWIEQVSPLVDQEINKVDLQIRTLPVEIPSFRQLQRMKRSGTQFTYNTHLDLATKKTQLVAVKNYFDNLLSQKQTILTFEKKNSPLAQAAKAFPKESIESRLRQNAWEARQQAFSHDSKMERSRVEMALSMNASLRR
jgi:hypothetical protein